MKPQALNHLRKTAFGFGPEQRRKKAAALRRLAAMPLTADASLPEYAGLLMFICAYPDDGDMLALAERELARITAFMKRQPRTARQRLVNTGLPFAPANGSFTHDLVRQLLDDTSLEVRLDGFVRPGFDLNEVLKITLPSLESSETTAGLANEDLLDVLRVKPDARLRFLVDELASLDGRPQIKDHFYDGLGIYIDIVPRNRSFSKAWNRLPVRSSYCHETILKRFDHDGLFRMPVHARPVRSGAERERLVSVIRRSLTLTDRETDTVTYMDERSLRLVDLEHGVSVALYGMVPERQMPLESYIGYTLFKNGFPAAYGGAWVFGRHADFGINIFESFRGGESGYLLCQLLRVYRQVFGATRFEIEPYQFGLDNPEGIASGAFWFYYRYGFRPRDAVLRRKARAEAQRIRRDGEYRTGRATLVRFTESPMVLSLSRVGAVQVGAITSAVTRMISRRFDGDRARAVKACELAFRRKARISRTGGKNEHRVLQELALWAAAADIRDLRRLDAMRRMVHVKPRDPYAYQDLLLAFFRDG